MRTQVYPRSQLGTLYRYREDSFRPDVYIYPSDDWPNLREQAYLFVDVIGEMRMRRRYDDYEILLDVPITLEIPGDTLAGHEIVFRVKRGNDRRDSYFAVIAMPGEYVKFRITQALSDSSVIRSREFVNAWVSAYLQPQ